MFTRPDINAPTPLRNKLLSSLTSNYGGNGGGVDVSSSRLARSCSTTDLNASSGSEKLAACSRTPDPLGFKNGIKPKNEDEELLLQRLKRYNLDYPNDYDQYLKNALDKKSKWFSREEKRRLNLGRLLPYETETHKDQAKYLCHVLVHLYIAIKSMDLEGLVSISTKDLADVRHDIELTLDTDFFNADLSFDVENLEDEDMGDEEDDEVKSSGVIGKVMPRSATVISVNHWTNELKTCLKMKFDLPLKLRASLAKTYYHLSLCTGQSIQTSLFINMFVKLTGGFTTLLVEQKLLVLNHKDLLNFLSQFYPDPDPRYNIYEASSNRADKNLLGDFMHLAIWANNFFEVTAMREIYDWTLSRYTPQTASLSLDILSHMLPIHVTDVISVLDYIPSLFHIWSNNSDGKAMDMRIISLLGRISYGVYSLIYRGEILPHNVLKSHGVFTELQFDYIINKIQENLRIDQKLNSFQGVSQILVYSITPQSFELFLERLNTLLKSLETFVHPSNSGSWTPLIAKFIQRFLDRYHERYVWEQKKKCQLPEKLKLTESMNSSVFEGFKEIVITGAQSKNESASNYYIASLGYICDMPSTAKDSLINRVLVDLYDSLTDQFINSNHRIIVALKQFTEISRFMIRDHLYRVHISNIVSLLIKKIGPNDMNLTNSVFNAIVTVFSLIQVKDLSNEDDFISFESNTINFINEHLFFIKEHPDESFPYDEVELKSAFIASTKYFEVIVKNLVDSYVTLLSADLNDKLLFKFSQTALIFSQSLSDDLFEYYAKLVEECLFNDELNNDGESEALLANLVASVIKRDPSRAKSIFKRLSVLIEAEVEKGAGRTRNNTNNILGGDKMLVLYLTVLSEILSVSLGEVLEFKDAFLKLMGFLYREVVNPSVQGSITYVIHKTLKNLTNIKLKNNHLFQNEPSPDDIDARWGLNQFDQSRFDEENLQFDWYIPSHIEVSFATEVFETIVIETLSKIDHLSVNIGSSDIKTSDEIIKNLYYLRNSLSGLSILFDPEFHQEDIDEGFHKTPLQKKLLILKSLKDSRSEDSELNIDIEEITKKDNDVMMSTPMKESDSENSAVSLTQGSQIALEESRSDAASVDQELNSRVITPSVPHESDLMSVMNPKIALRESKIYNCNYFFGSTSAMKRLSSNYNHIHSLRSLIGQSLHKLAVQLKDKEENNIKLVQGLLLTLRTYFCDVGKESSFDFDDQLFIDYTFMKKVQSVGNYEKPFTRVALGARIEKFHRQRIILHSTNRLQTKLDKLLLKDIVNLSFSTYSAIYQQAQIVMIETMKKLIGSYSYVIGIVLDSLELMIEQKDLKRVEAGLRTFRLKKVSHKISHDYKNISRIIDILTKCLNLKDQEIGHLAQLCLHQFSKSVQVPSAVALFNEIEIDNSLRPPDKNIDLEISTVKAAKYLKRAQYYQRLIELQELLIEKETASTHWKTSLLYLTFLVDLQCYHELPTNTQVIELLVKRATTHHPSLVRLCIKSVTRLVEKITSFASYHHSLVNNFNPTYLRDEITVIDTSSRFSKVLSKELSNYQNPEFFMDSPWSSGGLFWGTELHALKSGRNVPPLSSSDMNILSSIGKLISIEWLDKTLKTIAQENESKGVFQAIDVSLIETISQLIGLGLSGISYKDFLQLISDHYDKDDKASIITSSEIISGLLCSTKNTTEADIITRDEFLNKFLDQVLSIDITPESYPVWTVMFYIVPNKIDIRRVPILTEKVLDLESFLDVDSNMAFLQAARLGFLAALVGTMGARITDYNRILKQMSFAHPYTSVRDNMGVLLCTLCSVFQREGFDSSSEFLLAQNQGDLGASGITFPDDFHQFLTGLFRHTEDLRVEISSLAPQDQLKTEYFYMTYTLSKWLELCLHGRLTSLLVPLYREHISPFLMNLVSNRELCILGGLKPDLLFGKLGDSSFRPENIGDMLAICTESYSSIHQVQLQLSFVETFYSRSFLLLSSAQREQIIKHMDALLFHQSIEIRNAAAKVFSGIIHNSPGVVMIDELIQKYSQIISKFNSRKEISNKKMTKLHGSTVGIGALVGAFPYASPPPPWMSDQISTLARAASIPGVVGKSAKDILSNFKKLRADTWHVDRDSFSEDQLEDLEGVLWRSYFA